MKTLLIVLALAIACTTVQAQERYALPAQSGLPDSFGQWKFTGQMADIVRVNRPSDEVLKEAGETGIEGRHYLRGDKKIAVLCEQFRDPSGSYQAYTAQLDRGLSASTVAPLTAVGNDQLIALVGNRLVTISGIRNASDAELRLLLNSIKEQADRTPLPPVRTYLPEEQMVQGTQRYVLGPAGFDAALTALNESKFAAITPEIGFNSGAEAMLASYQTERNKAQDLLIIDYPTPQLAEQHLHHIQSVISANPALADVTVERKTSLLSLVLSPASPQAAAKLREAIQYQMQVTWNEPSQTLTDPPWVSVLKNIFTGTIVFCVFALVMGVAFGGVRVITKKFFPGKVFDRPEDMEVLQLGLSGKRIDPRDFY